MTIPHTKYGHSLNTHFRYLSCLLDREHIILHSYPLKYIAYNFINNLPNTQLVFLYNPINKSQNIVMILPASY